jgi:hypothetical protein
MIAGDSDEDDERTTSRVDGRDGGVPHARDVA